MKNGAQNELTGIYFDIGLLWGQMVHKGGAKLGFSGNFVSNCGKGGVPNCDAQWLTTKKGRQFLEKNLGGDAVNIPCPRAPTPQVTPLQVTVAQRRRCPVLWS